MKSTEVVLEPFDGPEVEFLDFILSQYVEEGETELEPEKLPRLLQLKYGAAQEAIQRLGRPETIRETFRGFQRGLYEAD